MSVSLWLEWSLIGIGPAIVVILLAVRAGRLGSVDAWQDWRDASEAGDWVIPGVALLAGIAISRSHSLGPTALALLTAAPVFVYTTVQHLTSAMHWAARDPDRARSTRRTVGSYVRDLGSPTGIAAYLLYSVLSAKNHHTLGIGVREFLWLAMSSWLGALIFSIGRSTTAYLPGTWRRLAPCELHTRVAEIAARVGVSIDEVRIVTDMPYYWAGGLAYSSSGFVLTEDLLQGLDKSEADAVIAHEVGHVAQTGYWWLYWPGTWIAWLAWLAVALVIEGWLHSLPGRFRFLDYALWLSLFLIPRLATNAYRRRGERGANLWLRVLDDPSAAISSMRRLAVVDRLAFSRPWWSRGLSTHPNANEEIERIARDAGLTGEQVAQAVRHGDREASDDSAAHYEPVFHDEPDGELLARPRAGRRGEVSSWYGGLVIMLVFGGLSLVASLESTLGIVLAVVLAGLAVVGIAAGVYVIIDRRRAAEWRTFRTQVAAALCDLHGPKADSGMLLLDVIRTAEWDDGRWQCALVGPRDGELTVLGELGEDRISPSRVTGAARWKPEESKPEAGVALWYEIDGAAQWIVLKPLGRAEKGEPRNLPEVETWLRAQLEAIGADLPDPNGTVVDRVKACAARVPAALAMLAAVMLLAWAVIDMLNLRWGAFPYYLILATTVPALWSWVAAAGVRKRGG